MEAELRSALAGQSPVTIRAYPAIGACLPSSVNKSHAVYPGGSCERDHVGYVLKVGVVVGFDEGYALDSDGEDIPQTFAQAIPLDCLFIHGHARMLRTFISGLSLVNMNHDSPVGRRDVLCG